MWNECPAKGKQWSVLPSLTMTINCQRIPSAIWLTVKSGFDHDFSGCNCACIGDSETEDGGEKHCERGGKWWEKTCVRSEIFGVRIEYQDLRFRIEVDRLQHLGELSIQGRIRWANTLYIHYSFLFTYSRGQIITSQSIEPVIFRSGRSLPI